jgi:hypothetical protein
MPYEDELVSSISDCLYLSLLGALSVEEDEL